MDDSKTFICILIGILFISGSSSKDCPSGFTRLSDSGCYSLLLTPVRTQPRARHYCRQKGSALALLHHRLELETVLAWLEAVDLNRPVWIGLHASDTREWTWDDGQTFNQTWWSSDEAEEGSLEGQTLNETWWSPEESHESIRDAGAIWRHPAHGLGVGADEDDQLKGTLCQIFVPIYNVPSTEAPVAFEPPDAQEDAHAEDNMMFSVVISVVVAIIAIVFIVIVVWVTR